VRGRQTGPHVGGGARAFSGLFVSFPLSKPTPAASQVWRSWPHRLFFGWSAVQSRETYVWVRTGRVRQQERTYVHRLVAPPRTHRGRWPPDMRHVIRATAAGLMRCSQRGSLYHDRWAGQITGSPVSCRRSRRRSSHCWISLDSLDTS
jgi:hypothetical protein